MLNQLLFLSLRCLFITNCASPATWQVVTVSNKSFDDGKWHKLKIRRDHETSLTVCEVDGFSKELETAVLKLHSHVHRFLFFGGIPNRSHGQGITPNGTCSPNVKNFSGCITDIKIHGTNSLGYAQVIQSNTIQDGTVWNHCPDENQKPISIVDKNAKVLLKVKAENLRNTSFEFRIRTKTHRGFVVKIAHARLTALLFLEDGKMKVTVRGENDLANERRSLYMAANRTFVADNQWHEILFTVVMGMGTILRIDDSLEARHVITSTTNVTSTVVSTGMRQQYVMLCFGRNSRKNLGFVGCVGDVYVNNQAVNLSKHPSVKNGKGISVGHCSISAGKEHVAWRHDKESNGMRLNATGKPLTKPESSIGAKDGVDVTSTFHSTTVTKIKSSRQFEHVYPIALGLGLPVSLLLIVSIFGASLNSRLHSWRRRTGIEKTGEPGHIEKLQRKDKENYTAHASCGLSSDYQGKGASCKVTTPAFGIKHESFNNENQEFAKKINQTPAGVIWEKRYGVQSIISHQRGSFVPGKSHHSFQSLFAEASERLTEDPAAVRLIIPPSEDCVIVHVPKNGPSRGLADTIETESGVGQGTSMRGTSRSQTRSNRVYSDYNSLPRSSRKASSRFWAYGTRFVRHESSDTDCSDAERVSAKRQGYQAVERAKFVTVRPRQQGASESSGNEVESSVNNLHLGRSQRLQTFTEKSYPLQSVKEEGPENESEHRGSFSSNAGKIYFREKKLCNRNRSTSLAEASILYEEAAAKGTQLRTTLDGYTSSCPDSIHCLSEKEDMYTKQSRGFWHNDVYI